MNKIESELKPHLVVEIPYRCQISYVRSNLQNLHLNVENSCELKIIGSVLLLEKIEKCIQVYGQNLKLWPIINPINSNEDILINELLQKIKSEEFIYNHDEICHCRMVKTDVVRNAIKSGCCSIADISRTTMAGTGCGACKKELKLVLDALLEPK